MLYILAYFAGVISSKLLDYFLNPVEEGIWVVTLADGTGAILTTGRFHSYDTAFHCMQASKAKHPAHQVELLKVIPDTLT